jgi:DNA helicase-2/ATP-dependent DNA helicase PcrA
MKGLLTPNEFFASLKSKGIVLSNEQKSFIKQTEGQIKVSCPGGNGKSIALVLKVAYLIGVTGIPPNKILVITYTKNAANELKDRLKDYVSDTGVTACTIHSLCYKLLSESGFYNNLSDRIKSERWRLSKLAKVLHILKLQDEYKAQELLPLITLSKSTLNCVKLKDFDRIYSKYDDLLTKEQALDFEDLILQTLRLKNTLQNAFKYVFLDEVQDSSRLEFKLVKSLSEAHRNLCILGDQNQSIFSFKGGDISIINDFSNHAKAYFFETNYRSTQNIVKLCNTFVDKPSKAIKFSDHKPKFVMTTDIDDEALYIVEYVKKYKGSLSDIAVMYRTSKARQHILNAFILNKIPYVTKDKEPSIYEQWNIKALLSRIKFLSGRPYDVIQSIIEEGECDFYEDLEFIAGEASRFSTISGFLNYVKELKTKETKYTDGVTLSTVHGAKGLSFKVVFVTGAVEGLMPHRYSLESKELIDEEKRIMYVALSRAEEELYITAPSIRFGKEQKVSRFLEAFFNAHK